ncbi:MAG: hypothetical protein PHP01_06860 [Phycisphaerae bacterium]|nr:hypothetical protein [Phycisphaerae bacterium]
MNKKQFEELAKNPKFISGIYNYCDRWCRRCSFTQRCMTFALCEDKFDNPQSKDISNKIFWDKLGDIFKVTLEMVKETAEKMGVDLNSIDLEKAAKHEERIHKIVEEQLYTQTAIEYVKMANNWFDSNKELLEDKADELKTQIEADIPGIKPVDEAIGIKDCLEIIRWYQHQIYVKLCRSAGGMIQDESEEIEYYLHDANGSAKVAIIGIERSIMAWGRLLNQFPQQEREILELLVNLKKLLRMVETAFPDARAFVRPGFDAIN